MLRYLETFFRNRWLITIPTLLLLLSGSAMAVMVQPQYGAMATIWAEKSTYLELPEQENRWVTPAQLHNGRFRELVRTATLSRAIADRVPAMAQATDTEKNRLAYDIRSNLYSNETGEHSIWVSFWHTNPEVPQAVVQIAIEEYNRTTALSATVQAAEAIKFYQDRIKTYETEILPQSSLALTQYLQDHPEVRLNLREGRQTDPQFAFLQEQADQEQGQYQRYQRLLDDVMTESQAASKHQEIAFRVMDPTQPIPGSGTLGKKKLLLYAGAGTGVGLGYAVLFLLLATELDRTMRHPGDVRHRLQIPVLEVIPDYTPRGAARHGKRARRRQPPTVAGTVPSHSGG